MTFDRHAQHPYNYAQPYQPSQHQQQPQHPQQSPYSPPQDQQQQQQQQPYLGAPLPWPPPPSGSGLVSTDMATYGQPIPSISSPTESTAATSISASNTTTNPTSGTSSSTTTTSNTQQQQQTEIKPTQQDPSKQYHPEWGVLREQDFHPLALKHQRDLENHFQNGTRIADFYFWQANLGGYCMADMNQSKYNRNQQCYIYIENNT